MKPYTLNHILKHSLPTRITSSYNFLDALEDIKHINQIVERPIYHIHQRNGKQLIIEDLCITNNFFNHLATIKTDQTKIKQIIQKQILTYSKYFCNLKALDNSDIHFIYDRTFASQIPTEQLTDRINNILNTF